MAYIDEEPYEGSYKQFGSSANAYNAMYGGGSPAPDTKEQWFTDYGNPNSDPQDLQERAKDLGINGRDWAEYHKRREAALDEAAKQF